MVREFDEPFPETEPVSLEIMPGASGRIDVAGDASGLVEGEIEYDVPEWAPRVERRGGKVSIIQAERARWRMIWSPVNRWTLRLGKDKPYGLSFRTSVSSGRWELGGLPLTSLELHTGVSQGTVNFGEPNPEEMGLLKVVAGVGGVSLSGLLDANFERMEMKGGVGEISLRFNGEGLRRDAWVSFDGGVGNIKIALDEGVPARARVRGLVSVSTGTGFSRRRAFLPSGGEYCNRAYHEADGPHLEFDVTVGVGSLRLRTL